MKNDQRMTKLLTIRKIFLLFWILSTYFPSPNSSSCFCLRDQQNFHNLKESGRNSPKWLTEKKKKKWPDEQFRGKISREKLFTCYPLIRFHFVLVLFISQMLFLRKIFHLIFYSFWRFFNPVDTLCFKKRIRWSIVWNLRDPSFIQANRAMRIYILQEGLPRFKLNSKILPNIQKRRGIFFIWWLTDITSNTHDIRWEESTSMRDGRRGEDYKRG